MALGQVQAVDEVDGCQGPTVHHEVDGCQCITRWMGVSAPRGEWVSGAGSAAQGGWWSGGPSVEVALHAELSSKD